MGNHRPAERSSGLLLCLPLSQQLHRFLQHPYAFRPPLRKLHNGIRACVADTAVTDPTDETAPVIFHELEGSHIQLIMILPQLLDGSHHDADRVPATDRVARFLKCSKPGLMAPTLAGSHALEVDGFDRIMDSRIFRRLRCRSEVDRSANGRLIVGIPEAQAPMSEVGRDDEEVGGIFEIGQ